MFRIPLHLPCLVLVCIAVSSGIDSQAASPPTFLSYWKVGGPGQEVAQAIAMDRDGATFVAGGMYQGAKPRFDFADPADPPQASADGDFYIAKYDKQGFPVWVNFIEHTGWFVKESPDDPEDVLTMTMGGELANARFLSIATDDLGAVYVSGVVRSGGTFPGLTNVLGPNHLFLARLGTNGLWQWVRSRPGIQTPDDEEEAILFVREAGTKAPALATFQNKIYWGTFDPPPTSSSFNPEDCEGCAAMIIPDDHPCNESLAGSFHTVDSSGAALSCRDFKVTYRFKEGPEGLETQEVAPLHFSSGPEGRMYYLGVTKDETRWVYGRVDDRFAPQTIAPHTQLNSPFHWRHVYSRSLGNYSLDSIATDSQGNFYIAGTVADWDWGTNSIRSATYNAWIQGRISSTLIKKDVMLIKLDSEGNRLWARTWEGEVSNIGQAVSDTKQVQVRVTAQGDIWLAGYFRGKLLTGLKNLNAFWPPPDSTRARDDVFVMKLNSQGETLWADHLPYGAFGFAFREPSLGPIVGLSPRGDLAMGGNFRFYVHMGENGQKEGRSLISTLTGDQMGNDSWITIVGRPFLQLLSPSVSSNLANATFSIQLDPGETAIIQKSSNLLNWIDFTKLVGNGELQHISAPLHETKEFWRARPE